MNATLEIVPSVLDRIRRTLVGLKMPRALEVLDQTVRQLERGESSALDFIGVHGRRDQFENCEVKVLGIALPKQPVPAVS